MEEVEKKVLWWTQREQAMRRVAERLQQALSEERPFALAVLDIDQYDEVRQRLGEDAAQEAVRQVQARLAGDVGERGEVLGAGRDEFVVALPGESTEDALLLTDRLRRAVEATPFRIGGEDVSLTVSAGINAVTKRGADVSDVVRRANEALYRSRQLGRNRVSLPPEESLVLKSNYYSRVQLQRLEALAKEQGKTEATILREALDQFLDRQDC